MNKFTHAHLKKEVIFNMLDRIEDKVNLMAHEIPEIKKQLRQWQHGKLKDSYFKEFLNKYFDKINQ